MNSRLALVGTGIAVVSMFVGCMVGGASATDAPSTVVPNTTTITKVETVTAAVTPEPAPKEAAPALSGPLTTFGDGNWEIGVDIAPGKYKTAGPTEGGIGTCFAQTEKEGNGELGDISQQEVSAGPMTFTIPAKGVKIFQTSGCQTWRKV